MCTNSSKNGSSSSRSRALSNSSSTSCDCEWGVDIGQRSEVGGQSAEAGTDSTLSRSKAAAREKRVLAARISATFCNPCCQKQHDRSSHRRFPKLPCEDCGMWSVKRHGGRSSTELFAIGGEGGDAAWATSE